MPFQKGNCANPNGRPKGAKDRNTKIREAFFGVFHELGKEGLREYAGKDPGGFYRVVASLLPKQLEADVNLHKHEDALLELE
jgi:hypothetical protein